MKKILTLIGALLLAVGLTVAAPSPAQAMGWSAQRCDIQAGNGAKVCIQVHSIPFNNGLKVDQYQACAYHYSDPGNHFRGFKNALVIFGGTYSSGPPNTSSGSGTSGTCATVSYLSGKLGLNACYHFYGTLDIALYDDKAFSVTGAIQGGAC